MFSYLLACRLTKSRRYYAFTYQAVKKLFRQQRQGLGIVVAINRLLGETRA